MTGLSRTFGKQTVDELERDRRIRRVFQAVAALMAGPDRSVTVCDPSLAMMEVGRTRLHHSLDVAQDGDQGHDPECDPMGGPTPSRSKPAMAAKRGAFNTTRVVRSGSVAAWMVAIRPHSLLVAFSPVLVGATLGYVRTGAIDLLAALLVLGAALLVQVITNMQNDVGYTLRGGDSSGTRAGLPRATANGWLSVRHVRTGIVFAALVATALGLALVAYRGWPVLAIGVASLVAALAYMGGPRPIAYTPFGELTVFVFFGLIAVIGTDWVLTDAIGTVSLLASVAIGALAAAALAVNNHRDVAHDRLVGRRTFAVTFGDRASRALYTLLLLGPFALVPALALLGQTPALLLPLLLLPAALQLRRDFGRCPPGTALNQILFRTFRLELWFAALLSAGALLGRALA